MNAWWLLGGGSARPLDSMVHGANMGPTWGRSAPDGPHVGPHEPCYQGGYPNIWRQEQNVAGSIFKYHNDFIKWKHFPHYWPLVRGIHRTLVNSLHKGPVMRSFAVFFDLHLNKRLSKLKRKLSRCWWFETHLHRLWCHCNAFSWMKIIAFFTKKICDF